MKRKSFIHNVKGKMYRTYLNTLESRERLAKTILRTKRIDPIVILPISEPVKNAFLKTGKHTREGRTYRLKTRTRRVTVVQGTVGAPALEIQLNAMHAAGAQCFIRADFCGSLSPDIHVGDICVAEDAVPQDGVSALYSQSEIIPADKKLLSAYLSEADTGETGEKNAVRHFVNRIITVDYFFAQTTELLGQWAQKAQCVDMETAALYAMCEKLQVPAVSVMTVSDEKLNGIDVFVSKDFPFPKLFSGVEHMVNNVIALIDTIDWIPE